MTTPAVKAILLLIGLFVCIASTRAADLTTFAAADKEAVRLFGTNEGYAYMRKFLDAMDQSVGQALRVCLPNTPGRKNEIHFQVAFIVSADGRIERMLCSTDSPSAWCFTKTIRAPRLPRPPRDHWPVVAALTMGP